MRETVETRANERPDIGTRCAVCRGARGPFAMMAAGDVAAIVDYGVTVTGDTRADLAVCDPCVALAARWAIVDGRPAVGYVNADGTAVVSWGGAPIARIVRSSRLRSTFGGDGLAWSAELPSGAKCYGRNAGRGMVTNIRSAVRHA